MRVTHVITRLIVGGAQENTVASVLGLRHKPGVEVNLICGPTEGPEGSLVHLCREPAGLLITMPELVRRISPWNDFLAWRALTRFFRITRPEVVHTHSGKAGILGRLAAARAGVRVIVHTIHGPSFGKFQGTFANTFFRAAEMRAARVTTHFVAVCEAMKRQYLAAGLGQLHQYTTILSGFDLEPFLNARNDNEFRAELGIAPDDVVVTKLARLFKLKGHDDLFNVAAELVRACPRIKVLLIGDGVWRSRLENRARVMGLKDHFVFAGLVAPEQVPKFLGVTDVLVHLSAREGLARALPQALAAGRPIIAYDLDGAGEVCRDGETGFLLTPGDLKTLRSRILELAGDPALRIRLGQRGSQLVRERFGVARMVDDLYALYRRLLAQAFEDRLGFPAPERRIPAKF